MYDDPFFDPLRLKILIMPYQEANPVGRNADYFFLKGFKEGTTEDYAHSMASYLKGLDIKSDHLLCRFNLGVTLFKLGLFEEACLQYNILVKQGYGDRAVVNFNKALCEL
jgi:tetratricopeptide (TPR) repeat protein